MEVFIIPQADLSDLLDENGELRDITGREEEYESKLTQYKAEFDDLEWKHSKLSRTYKELFSKQNKTRRNLQELEEKVKTLESDRSKLINALKEERKITEKFKMEQHALNKPSSGLKSPKSDDVNNFESDKIKDDSNPKNKDLGEDKEDKDIWTVLKSRLTKKEEEKEERN